MQAFFKNEGDIQIDELDLTGFTGLTEIATSVFRGWSIKSLKLPASIEKLGQFNTVFDLNEVNWTNLTNLTEIASSAFSGTDLTAADLSNTKVSTIGWRAFYNCSQLKSVILPNTISSIGDEAFMDMAEGSSITIPEEKFSLLAGKYTESKTDVITIGSETPDDSDLIVLTHDRVNSYYSSLGAAARNAVAGDSLAIVDGKTYTFADGEAAVVADGVTVSDALKTACGATYADKDSSYTAYCDTLQTALTHCEDGSLVTLNKDVAVSENLQITSDITIDLDDHTVTNNSSFAAPFLIKAGVECTIQNGTVSNTCSGWGICIDTKDDSVTTLSDLTLTNTNKQDSIPSSIRVRSCIVVLDGVTMEDQYLYHDSAEHNSTVFFTGNNSLGTNLLKSGIGSWSLYFENTESGTQPISDRTNVTQYVLNCGVDDLTSLDPVQRTGYGLTWYTDSSCTGTPVESPTPNETYYAKWIEETEEETTDADSATELAESPNTGVSNVIENETSPGSTTGDSVSQGTDPTQAQSDLTPIESAEEEPAEDVLEETSVDAASKTENENTLTMSLTHRDSGNTVYSFYVGNEKLGKTDTGETTLSYDTTLKGLKIGPNTVTVYAGSDKSGSQVGTITVNLKQKPVTVTGLSAVNRDYNGSRNVTLTGGTLNDIEEGDTVDFTATGTVSSASAGTGKLVTVDVTLTGRDAKWYDATASGTVTVDIYETSSSSGGSDSDPSYSPILDVSDGGEISVNPRTPEEDEDVTITIDPDAGYELDDLTVTDRNGDEIDVTANRDGTYTFTQPRGRVTISVTFARTGGSDLSFIDVPAGAYYYDAVYWAVDEGITNGTTAVTFSPDNACTRAQMVTFLWRAAGEPEPETSVNPFTDVSASAYYYDAVLWAVEQGITNGTSATTFSPDATVTRGQTVTFLWRNAGSPAVSGGSFTDVAADAYYAGAVAWAASEGITSGTTAATFSPSSNCTRAQIVTFLYRYLG